MRLLPLLALAGLGAYLLSRARTAGIDPDERIRRSVVALAAVLAIPGVIEVSNLLETR